MNEHQTYELRTKDRTIHTRVWDDGRMAVWSERHGWLPMPQCGGAR